MSDNTTTAQFYRLLCPRCGSSELIARKEDMDEEDFINDPIVGCLKCQAMIRVSQLTREEGETSYGHTLHMMKGGGA